MTKTEIQTIKNLIARLQKPHLGSAIESAKGWEDERVRIYLDTWVTGPLELLIGTETMTRDPELAKSMSQ